MSLWPKQIEYFHADGVDLAGFQRLVVVGTTGSGKTTLAARLAQHAGCQHIELDSLFWEAEWTAADDALFLTRVANAIAPDRWVVDGNYRRAAKLVWPRAELIVWLDYPLVVNLWRLLRRGVRRAWTQEPLWASGNRETFSSVFLSRESLFLWAIQTHRGERRALDRSVP